MAIEIAKWIVILFGSWIIFVAFVMLIAPKKARAILRKAGSTNFINYAEITLRLIPAFALILYSDFSKLSNMFKIFGWIMVVTSLLLYIIPRHMHHNFAMKSADILKPKFLQFLSPLAFVIGGFLIYNTL